MDSRGWLAALAAVAIGLWGALFTDLIRTPATARGGRIIADWNPAAVQAIRVEHRGRPSLVVLRDRGGWRIAEPIAAPADPSAVGDMLGTLEIMSARRRDRGRVSDPALSVTVERTGAAAITLDLARDTGATDRVWLSRRGEDQRALVDGYQLRALDLTADDLRERRPLRGRLRGASRIEIATRSGRIVLDGPAWTVGGVRADPDRVAAILAALERMRAASFLPRDPGGPVAVAISVVAEPGRSDVTVHGDCDGGAAAQTPVGSACLPEGEIAALAALAEQGPALADRRLLAAAPDQVTRVRVSAGARAIAIDRAEQPEVVRDWATRFAAAAAPAPPIAAAGLPVTGRVEVDGEDGREELAVLRAPDGRLCAQRAGEPVAFRLADPGLVDPSPRNFRSLELISADPTDLRAARRGAEHIERGELLEEWRALAPAGATVDTAAAAALAEAVAGLRAARVAPVQAPRAYRPLTVELAPPPGQTASIRHRIDLARGPAGTCVVRLDRDPTAFELTPDTCAALQRPWTTR